MNIGIITIHNHHNYGAVLQAFALNFAIRRFGGRCETIDCNIEPENGRVFKWTRYPGALVPNLYAACRRISCKKHNRRFSEFIRQQIPTTKSVYRTLQELVESPPRFDVYITGSDQVWRPSMLDREIGAAFHLCFASPDDSRLVAYAPSFGVSDIPPRYIEMIKNYLMRYDALSVREARGREIIYELTGLRAEVVLDPTLLLALEDYEQITRPPSISGDYLLVYPMEVGEDHGFFRLVKEVKRRVRLPIVCVLPLVFSYKWLYIADKIILEAGPGEFLGLIKDASFICTNSYHGTIFSILYRKRFLGFSHSGANTRIQSLLELLGLAVFQVTDLSPRNVQQMVETYIDYDSVASRLQPSIESSLKFLYEAVS